MTVLLKTTAKEIMGILKKIILENGIPTLHDKGFQRSPFSGADFGLHPSIGYLYDLCRVSKDSLLETVEIQVIKGNRWIQIWLNVFELTPKIKSVDELNGMDGLKFKLAPCSLTNTRLHIVDIKVMPLFSRPFMSSYHKLK